MYLRLSVHVLRGTTGGELDEGCVRLTLATERSNGVICSNCDTHNEPDRNYCRECGARLSVNCSSCGANNTAGAKFCGECGTPLAEGGGAQPEATIPVARPTTPVAERRVVSILFADLVGFTPFAEERDAEDVRDALYALLRARVRNSRALRWNRREVHRRRCDGRVGRSDGARGRSRARGSRRSRPGRRRARHSAQRSRRARLC